MPVQGSLKVERMCELARVSRASFYRSLQEQVPVEESMEVRSAIQRIALEHRRRYGYRRVTAELKRRGMAVNRKRVARIMREDNLLAVQPKRFVTTTDSKHALEVYLNLARRMHLTAKDQLWIADITYIRPAGRVRLPGAGAGWILAQGGGLEADRTLASRLAIDALELAIATRKPLPGLVHHSDRGIQYASGEYVAILRKHEMIPSMSRPANPYDNASCKSFIKTLKREEIYANQYQDLDHLRSNIEEFIERYYNQKRLHSALDYRSPEEFEQDAQRESEITTVGATVRFFPLSEEKASTLLAGEGTQTPSLPQTPSLLENQRDGR